MKEHAEKGINMSVLRYEAEAAYISDLARFQRDIEAGQYPENWMGYCILPWPRHGLYFLEGSKAWCNARKFERRHRTEGDGSYFFGWHNRQLFLAPPEERRRLYVATAMSWVEYKTCSALSVPSGPVLAYKANAMVYVDEKGRISRERDLFLQVAVADRCVMVFMPFSERLWAWSSKRSEGMSDLDLRMFESIRDVLFLLPSAMIERVHRVGVC